MRLRLGQRLKKVKMMFYTPFYEILPELAMEETRSITVVDRRLNIPPGEYAILELYCSKKGCDCRRVFLNVISLNAQDTVAVIAYGWESKEFYAKWLYKCDRIQDLSKRELQEIDELKGPSLNLMSPQSEYAKNLLDLIARTVLKDKAYIDRLKKHYALFKANLDKRPGHKRDAKRR